MKTVLRHLLLVSFLVLTQAAVAGSATWLLDPLNGDWNTAANWSPGTVPNGADDLATFSASNVTDISVSAETTVAGVAFTTGASPFTITTGPIHLTIGDAGVSNASGIMQNIVIGNLGGLYLTGSATAGTQTTYNNTGSPFTGHQGFVVFLGTATAGDGTFINERGLANQGGGGYMQLADTSTAGNGTFINEGAAVRGAAGGYIEFGGVTNPGSNAGMGNFTLEGGTAAGAYGGQINFYCYTSAANATFTVEGATASDALPGFMYFACDANAANATFLATGGSHGGPGGSLMFADEASGGTGQVTLLGNSTLDISQHDAPGMSIGSVQGSGAIFLGGNSLSVGSNNLDAKFTGSLHDGGAYGGSAGSLTKIGTGTLFLAGDSDYTGDTHVAGGRLLLANSIGSATGSGNVFVDAGELGGSGHVAGAVTVGNQKRRAQLQLKDSPLSVEGSVTLGHDGRCRVTLNSDEETAGSVTAAGVTIAGASFIPKDLGTAILPAGFSFTVINNTSAEPITGTFNNLADGATITAANNSYQASYEGGDGNDLTLTVVQ